jgi:cytochrome P450
LAAVLYAFATHPDQWQRLRTEPHLARVAFDEAVRRESPVQAFFRTATSDIRIGGTTIPNRDPRRPRRAAETAPQQHPARVGISYRAG